MIDSHTLVFFFSFFTHISQIHVLTRLPSAIKVMKDAAQIIFCNIQKSRKVI